MTRILATAFTFALCLSLPGAGHAALVSFQFIDTVSMSGIPEVSTGTTARVTANLDNGGTGTANQTWTAADMTSIVFDFDNGALLTTFLSPFGGGLDITTGDFRTDAAGDLIEVPSSWRDFNVGSDFTSNGSGTPFSWSIRGSDSIYITAGSGEIFVTNVADMVTPAGWEQVTAAPTPASAVLMLLGLFGIIRIRRLQLSVKAPVVR